jgi:N-acetylglutamate synthase-like GNAT family acetyltransferase
MTAQTEQATVTFTPGDYWTPERALNAVAAMTAKMATPEMRRILEQMGEDFSETHVGGLQQPSHSPTLTRSGIVFRRAQANDVPELTRVIIEADLPPLFIEEFAEGFIVAENHNRLLAVGGIELYEGGAGFVRNVAVDKAGRGLGLGRDIAELLYADARASGVRDVFLFTQDAYLFWKHMGYIDVPLDAWPLSSRACWQYRYVVEHLELMMRIGVHSMWKAA